MNIVSHQYGTKIRIPCKLKPFTKSYATILIVYLTKIDFTRLLYQNNKWCPKTLNNLKEIMFYDF